MWTHYDKLFVKIGTLFSQIHVRQLNWMFYYSFYSVSFKAKKEKFLKDTEKNGNSRKFIKRKWKYNERKEGEDWGRKQC